MSNDRCTLEKIDDCSWRCTRCGRIIAKAYSGDCSEPDPERLPPCGWRPMVLMLSGHVWSELPPDGVKRVMRCQLCAKTMEFPASASNETIGEALYRAPECPKPNPSFIEKITRYFRAVSSWAGQGRPVRSPIEVERIFQICVTCEVYDEVKGACRKCGCYVNKSTAAWRNKIAMATESCPLGKW